MEKVIIIGTLHAGSTPNKELKKVLERYKPDKILVEIAQIDIKNKKIKTYPTEMQFTYNWAKKVKIKVNGFDSKINVFAKGKTEKDNQKAIREQEKILRKFTWKDMNKEKNLKLIDTPSAVALVDKKKAKKRETEMLNNIKKEILPEGKTVIVTGAGHLSFFEKRIKNAIFPFR